MSKRKVLKADAKKDSLNKIARNLAKTYKARKSYGDFVPSAHDSVISLLEKLEKKIDELRGLK